MPAADYRLSGDHRSREMDQTTRGTFAIGRWLVEPDLNRLSSGEEAVHLQPRTMDVLVYLADRAGRVVSADDMIRDVWRDRPMGDNPVYKAIAQLRKALAVKEPGLVTQGGLEG